MAAGMGRNRAEDAQGVLMSDYQTVTIRLKPDLARQIDAIRTDASLAQTRCNALEAGGDADGAARADRERIRLDVSLAPLLDRIEQDARHYAKAQGIAISDMPAWRIQFCRPDSSVAMVEFFEDGKGY